jgi:recombination protein RecA
MYTEGISRTGSILDLGLEQKILEKKGSWIAYEGQLIGQGREAAKLYLQEHPDVGEKISAAVMGKVQIAGGMTLGASNGEAAE